MDESTLPLILSELRDLRAAFNDFASEHGQRMATAEAQLRDVYGNGKIGRLSTVELAVAHLEKWKYWLVGVGAGTGAMISVVVTLWRR